MYLLADLDFYIQAFDNRYCNNSLRILSSKHILVINKDMINYIETKIPEEQKERFQSFIIELSDNNKHEPCDSIKVSDFLNTCKSFFNQSKHQFLIPITNSNSPIFTQTDFHNLINLKSTCRFEQNIIEVIMNNTIQLTYSNFSNNNEIDFLIEKVLALPKHIKQAFFFNREADDKFLTKLQGNKIIYYTLLDSRNQDIEKCKEFRKEQSSILGGNFELYTTRKRTVLHERCFFIGDLCISFDNSFNNININEPSWNMYITYKKDNYNNWIKGKELDKNFKKVNIS